MPLNWNVTLDTVREEKCVLFIGPEIFHLPEKGSLQQQIESFLDIEKTEDTRIYDDGLFYFRERSRKTEVYYQLKTFFDQSFPHVEQLMEKIAKIPFHLIITINPDKLLESVFQRLNFKHSFDFLWKNQPPKEYKKLPDKQNPLIYNLFGSIERQESLVLTHDDLFDYLECVLQSNSMPNRLKHHLVDDAKNFIFLGIPFDKWYMQLLLRVLHMHKDIEFMKFAANKNMQPTTRSFCYEQFKIDFISDGINSFISELYSKCVESDLIRTEPQKKEDQYAVLMNWLKNDEIDKVLNGFQDMLENNGNGEDERIDDLVLITNRHKRLKRKINQGIVDNATAQVESAKISRSILELINEAKAMA